MRKIKLHKDPDTEEYYLKLRSVLYGTGIKTSDVDSYDLIPFENGFKIVLFDKDGNQLSLDLKNKFKIAVDALLEINNFACEDTNPTADTYYTIADNALKAIKERK